MEKRLQYIEWLELGIIATNLNVTFIVTLKQSQHMGGGVGSSDDQTRTPVSRSITAPPLSRWEEGLWLVGYMVHNNM